MFPEWPEGPRRLTGCFGVRLDMATIRPILSLIPIPEDPECSYLSESALRIKIRNESNCQLLIQAVSCQFDQEQGTSRNPFRVHPSTTLAAGQTSNILSVPFTASLTFKPESNFCDITARVRSRRGSNWDRPESVPLGKLIWKKFVPCKREPKTFFLGHKDPEDKRHVERLNYYLTKAGFRGYMAEEDPRPGDFLWEEKIEARIQESAALLVLWTRSAASNPSNVKREIELAMSIGKRIIPIVEKGISPPDYFPRETVEHVELDPAKHDPSLVKVVQFLDLEERGGRF